MTTITSRAEWGARYAAGGGAVALPVAELWLHHSVTAAPADDAAAERSAMRTLENIGESRFGQGISYTYAVMPSGRIYEGTGAGRLGTHTGGRNSRSHGIVLVGNYEDTVPSSAMCGGTGLLVRHGHESGWWANPWLTGGHRDVKSTACPGRHGYAAIGTINERAQEKVMTPEEHNMLADIFRRQSATDAAVDPRGNPLDNHWAIGYTLGHTYAIDRKIDALTTKVNELEAKGATGGLTEDDVKRVATAVLDELAKRAVS